jgi:predicted RNA-binding Zn-ribbon protein involved in translation (DUF1610 family)
MTFKCPGAFRIRQAEPETIKCFSCGVEVEIWTDEIKTQCPKCKTTVLREQQQSCIEWCKYAKECVGVKAYNKYMQNKLRQGKNKKQSKKAG